MTFERGRDSVASARARRAEGRALKIRCRRDTCSVGPVAKEFGTTRLEPGSPLVLYNLARDCALTDQFDRAAEALEKALSLGYRDFNWLAKDPDLRKLRKHPLYQGIEGKIRQMKNAVG